MEDEWDEDEVIYADKKVGHFLATLSAPRQAEKRKATAAATSKEKFNQPAKRRPIILDEVVGVVYEEDPFSHLSKSLQQRIEQNTSSGYQGFSETRSATASNSPPPNRFGEKKSINEVADGEALAKPTAGQISDCGAPKRPMIDEKDRDHLKYGENPHKGRAAPERPCTVRRGDLKIGSESDDNDVFKIMDRPLHWGSLSKRKNMAANQLARPIKDEKKPKRNSTSAPKKGNTKSISYAPAWMRTKGGRNDKGAESQAQIATEIDGISVSDSEDLARGNIVNHDAEGPQATAMVDSWDTDFTVSSPSRRSSGLPHNSSSFLPCRRKRGSRSPKGGFFVNLLNIVRTRVEGDEARLHSGDYSPLKGQSEENRVFDVADPRTRVGCYFDLRIYEEISGIHCSFVLYKCGIIEGSGRELDDCSWPTAGKHGVALFKMETVRALTLQAGSSVRVYDPWVGTSSILQECLEFLSPSPGDGQMKAFPSELNNYVLLCTQLSEKL